MSSRSQITAESCQVGSRGSRWAPGCRQGGSFVLISEMCQKINGLGNDFVSQIAAFTLHVSAELRHQRARASMNPLVRGSADCVPWGGGGADCQ